MPFFRQPHLDEARENRDLLAEAVGAESELREPEVRTARRTALRPEEPAENALANFRQRKTAHRAAQVAAGVAVLEASHEQGVEGGTRDDAELPGGGNRARQSPTGDPDSHPPLDHLWKHTGT